MKLLVLSTETYNCHSFHLPCTSHPFRVLLHWSCILTTMPSSPSSINKNPALHKTAFQSLLWQLWRRLAGTTLSCPLSPAFSPAQTTFHLESPLSTPALKTQLQLSTILPRTHFSDLLWSHRLHEEHRYQLLAKPRTKFAAGCEGSSLPDTGVCCFHSSEFNGT